MSRAELIERLSELCPTRLSRRIDRGEVAVLGLIEPPGQKAAVLVRVTDRIIGHRRHTYLLLYEYLQPPSEHAGNRVKHVVNRLSGLTPWQHLSFPLGYEDKRTLSRRLRSAAMQKGGRYEPDRPEVRRV